MRTLLAFFLMAGLWSGCRVTLPADRTPGLAPHGNAELTGYIAELPYVTAEAGYRAAHALWKGASFDGDFAALASALRSGEIVGDWDHSPNDLLSRSDVGYMICRAADVRSGLNWRMTGLGRYAWRELTYQGIASPGNEYGFLSGGEFLGILARADDFRARRAGSLAQRATLGAPPG